MWISNQKGAPEKEGVADWDDSAVGIDICIWGCSIGCFGGYSGES